MTGYRYHDPDCTCLIVLPDTERLWCDHCEEDGPLPGSLADPQGAQRNGDPTVLRRAAARIADQHPGLAHTLRSEADRLEVDRL